MCSGIRISFLNEINSLWAIGRQKAFKNMLEVVVHVSRATTPSTSNTHKCNNEYEGKNYSM